MNLSEIESLKTLQDEYTKQIEMLESLISRGVKMRWTSDSCVMVESVVIHVDSISFVPYTYHMEKCDKETFTFPYEAFESDVVLFKYFNEFIVFRELKKKQENDVEILKRKRYQLELLCKEIGVKSPLDNV